VPCSEALLRPPSDVEEKTTLFAQRALGRAGARIQRFKKKNAARTRGVL
jgi:hypothetical protein